MGTVRLSRGRGGEMGEQAGFCGLREEKGEEKEEENSVPS